MANRDQILDVLTLLSQAYPEKNRARETLELYVQNLADIPYRLLDKAARQHIRVSNWFPRIAELRGTAVRLAGTPYFPNLQPEDEDPLTARALALEDRFYRQGQLEKEPWQVLIRQFELAGRSHRAEYTRQRMERLISG